MKKRILLMWMIVVILPCVAMAALTISSVGTLDSGGSARTTFSSTEKISFSIKVNNTVASSGRVQFSFIVKDPAGRRVLTQTGNSAPGLAGASGADIKYIPIEKFFKSPGYYTLEVAVSLEGSSVSGSRRFRISSPIVTLSYPPSGNRNLTMRPLTFRWAGSGATRYRIYVGDHQSLTLNVFTEVVSGASFSYPDNPANEQHKLVSGQVYYWKVEGLGVSGNVIATTPVPFSFSVMFSGAQMSRDIAIKEINVGKNPLAPGFVPLVVYVKNQGSTTESNISVNVFINGLPVKKPKTINRIEPGKIKKMVFPVRLPEITDKILVTASHDLFDDNMINNRYSRIFDEDELMKNQGKKARADRLNLAEAWEKTKRILNRPAVVSKFEGYTLYAIEPDDEEGIALFRAFLDGKARVIKIRVKVKR